MPNFYSKKRFSCCHRNGSLKNPSNIILFENFLLFGLLKGYKFQIRLRSNSPRLVKIFGRVRNRLFPSSNNKVKLQCVRRFSINLSKDKPPAVCFLCTHDWSLLIHNAKARRHICCVTFRFRNVSTLQGERRILNQFALRK